MLEPGFITSGAGDLGTELKRSFGLSLNCNVDLADLPAGPLMPGREVEVQLQQVENPFADAEGQIINRSDMRIQGRPAFEMILQEDGVSIIRLSPGREFRVSPDGLSVEGRWSMDAGIGATLATFYGPVLAAAAARIGGCVVMHASSVVVGDSAVLIGGPQGGGKSTLAASLEQKGLPVIADDSSVLMRDDSGWQVHCGPRILRLWPDSAETTRRPSAVLYPGTTKRSIDLGDAPLSLPPRALFVLDHELADPVIELTGPPAFAAAASSLKNLKNSTPAQLQAEMTLLAEAIQDIRVFKLKSRTGLENVSALSGTLLSALD
jgi:hypothetical protein